LGIGLDRRARNTSLGRDFPPRFNKNLGKESLPAVAGN